MAELHFGLLDWSNSRGKRNYTTKWGMRDRKFKREQRVTFKPLSDRFHETLKESVKFAFEPAKRGDSIKPGVERSGTPGSVGGERKEPAKWATAGALSHASRAQFHYLSLSWGSASLHPRLYASTRSAGFGNLSRIN